VAPVQPAPAPAPTTTSILDLTGPEVPIPGGVLRVGSLPGTPHRRPSVEADLAPVEVPAFTIDRRPYPNEPDAPPQQEPRRRRAAARCAERGQRLCHELEWERACVAGALEGVGDAPEWTADDAGERLARLTRTAVVRGTSERCGARASLDPEDGRGATFRCCRGPAPDALPYPGVGSRARFRDLDLSDAEARAILAGVPELADVAGAFVSYGLEEAERAIARGDVPPEEVPWELAPGPFSWSPSPGEELLILFGRSGERTVLAALYPLVDGAYRHAGSFLFEDEVAPLALLRSRSDRRTLQWTACYTCGGESGVIAFDPEDASITVAQR
jgi:hypothetical protein